MSAWKLWRWPVQVYVEAASEVDAVEILTHALDEALGHYQWMSDQRPVIEERLG